MIRLLTLLCALLTSSAFALDNDFGGTEALVQVVTIDKLPQNIMACRSHKYYIAYHMTVASMNGTAIIGAWTDNFAWHCSKYKLNTEERIKGAIESIKKFEREDNHREGFIVITTIVPLKR